MCVFLSLFFFFFFFFSSYQLARSVPLLPTPSGCAANCIFRASIIFAGRPNGGGGGDSAVSLAELFHRTSTVTTGAAAGEDPIKEGNPRERSATGVVGVGGAPEAIPP